MERILTFHYLKALTKSLPLFRVTNRRGQQSITDRETEPACLFIFILEAGKSTLAQGGHLHT